jgi:hypothetical protein
MRQYLPQQPTVKAERLCSGDFYTSLPLEWFQVPRRKSSSRQIAYFTANKEISLPECVSQTVRETTDFHHELDSYRWQNRAG